MLARLDSLYHRDAELGLYVEQISTIREEFVRVRDTEVIPLIRQQKKDEATALVLGVQAERFGKIRALAKEFAQHPFASFSLLIAPS